MNQEIKTYSVYTTEETKKFLKISDSTVKRFLKSGLIKANKVGGQYRILGEEILRLVSTKIEHNRKKYIPNQKQNIEIKYTKWQKK